MLLAMTAAAFSDPDGINRKFTKSKAKPTQPKEKPLPPGVTEYHFDRRGVIFFEKNDNTVFSCVARDKDNAFRKFNNFYGKIGRQRFSDLYK